MSIPTPEEVGQLMVLADERFQPFIGLCAFAGLRLGEAAGVQLGDVDFLRKSLRVSRQVQRVNGGAIDVRAPKYGSERVVYLADSLINVLAEHVSDHGTTGKARWLFAGEGDDPPHQNTVGYWWRKTLRDAGLTGIKLHDLRHFYASGLIAAGCDVVTVQRSLGHEKRRRLLARRTTAATGRGGQRLPPGGEGAALRAATFTAARDQSPPRSIAPPAGIRRAQQGTRVHGGRRTGGSRVSTLPPALRRQDCESHVTPGDGGERPSDSCLVDATVLPLRPEGEDAEGVRIGPGSCCQWPGDAPWQIGHRGADQDTQAAERDQVQVPLAEPRDRLDPERADPIRIVHRKCVRPAGESPDRQLHDAGQDECLVGLGSRRRGHGSSFGAVVMAAWAALRRTTRARH
jgi:hypothetical protein